MVQPFETWGDDVLSTEQHSGILLHIPAVHSYTNNVQPGSFGFISAAWLRPHPTVSNAPVMETECVFQSHKHPAPALLWAAPCGVDVDEWMIAVTVQVTVKKLISLFLKTSLISFFFCFLSDFVWEIFTAALSDVMELDCVLKTGWNVPNILQTHSTKLSQEVLQKIKHIKHFYMGQQAATLAVLFVARSTDLVRRR